MQCWNCGFENIPGLRACARCASTLSLDGVSVEPPRASRLRPATRLRRLGNGLRALAASPWGWVCGFRFLPRSPVSAHAIAWSLIPGLGHIRQQRARVGWLILVTWLALLVTAVAFMATPWSWWARVAMLAVHAFAVVCLLAPGISDRPWTLRMAYGLLVCLLLQFGVYWPAQWFLTRLWLPLPFAAAGHGDLIHGGDTLLFEGPWLRPRSFARGDLVTYHIRRYQGNGVIVHAGLGVERVIGVPGDCVELTERRLTVNGSPPPEGQTPLGATVLSGDFRIELADREYLILPTQLHASFHGGAPQLAPQVFRHLCVAPYEDVLGRVMLRVQPLSRFGRIE